MKFNKMTEVIKAVNELRAKKTGKNLHYPVLFKKALCEFIENTNTTANAVALSTGMPVSGVHRWYDQYKEGLFKMDGAYAVSHKSKSLNASILAKLKQEVGAIQEKIELVERAEALGMKISE